MSDKCKFCGSEQNAIRYGVGFYDCHTYHGIASGEWCRHPDCYARQIAALEAEVKQLRDEDATDPIDERLAAAGKIFRELVAEREELRREVKGLREVCASALMSLEAQRKYIVDDLQAINHGEDAIGALQSALAEAKQ